MDNPLHDNRRYGRRRDIKRCGDRRYIRMYGRQGVRRMDTRSGEFEVYGTGGTPPDFYLHADRNVDVNADIDSDVDFRPSARPRRRPHIHGHGNGNTHNNGRRKSGAGQDGRGFIHGEFLAGRHETRWTEHGDPGRSSEFSDPQLDPG